MTNNAGKQGRAQRLFRGLLGATMLLAGFVATSCGGGGGGGSTSNSVQLSSIAPNTGPFIGGLEVTLHGTHFTNPSSAPVVVSRPFSVSLGDAFACSSVLVEATSPCDFDTEVFVPESFSPNGDGTNETFVIPGIEGYPGNTITIFNRWGAKLYSASGYDNKNVVWDGSSPNATLAGPAAADWTT